MNITKSSTRLVALVAGVAVALSLLVGSFASAASAATISNPLFSNGQTTIDANGSATVSGTFTLTVGPGEVVEWLRTQSDPSQPFVDTSVGGTLGYQEQVYTNVPFSVKVPPNTGTFYPTVQGAGNFGGNRAINGGDSTSGSVVSGPFNLGTVRVVAGAEGSGSVGGADAPPSWFQSWLNTFNMQQCVIGGGTWSGTTCAPKTVPADTICSEFQADLSGLYQGTQDPAGSLGRVGTLQSFLMSKGFDIPLLRQNLAKYGYYGPQTANAVVMFRSAHASCN